MDVLYFILRYTPFWAVPLMLICLQYGYIYWLKSIRKVSMAFAVLGASSGGATLGGRAGIQFCVRSALKSARPLPR